MPSLTSAGAFSIDYFGTVSARRRIGNRRHFAYLARHDAVRTGPDADPHIADAAQRIDLVFRDSDHDFFFAQLRYPHHWSAGGDHLADLGVHAGDDAIDVRHQRRIAGLVRLAFCGRPGPARQPAWAAL